MPDGRVDPAAPPALRDSSLPYVTREGFCSAEPIAPRIAVTAAHCLPKAPGGVLLAEVRNDVVQLPVVRTWASRSDDIALLWLSSDAPRPAPVADRVPALGEPGWVVGYGCDSDWIGYARVGIRPVRMLGRDEFGAFIWEGQACHGDSGGGLFDASGRLVAILNGSYQTNGGPITQIVGTPIAFALSGLPD
jgi:hypothetical protein